MNVNSPHWTTLRACQKLERFWGTNMNENISVICHTVRFLSLSIWMASGRKVNVRLPGISIDNVSIVAMELEDGSRKNLNVRLSNNQTVFVRVTNFHARAT